MIRPATQVSQLSSSKQLPLQTDKQGYTVTQDKPASDHTTPSGLNSIGMGFSTTDILVSVPNAELHKVVNNSQQLLQHGPFTVSISTPAPNSPPDQGIVEAAVGVVHWPLGKHLPALKAADGIYSFALAHTKAEYLIVVLPKGVQ
jgi:hypothetical protein